MKIAIKKNSRMLGAGGAGRCLRMALWAAALPLGAASFSASAIEGGTFGNYGVGAMTVAAGLLPPPGETYFYGYLAHYSADRFVDGNGDSMIPGFNLDLTVEATQIKHTWKFKIAGLSVGSGIIQEAVHVDIEAGGQRDKATGNFLLALQPLILGGNSGNLHFSTSSYISIPAGDYDADSLANHVLNYYSFTQDLALTWLPTPQWMLDLVTNVSINSTNHDTNYHSGDFIAFTWGAQYRPASAPKWQVGVSGLYLDQFEDDRLNGDKVPGGFKLLKINGGPQVAYWPTQTMAIVAKWHHEFEVENGPKGDLFWLQVGMPFGG